MPEEKKEDENLLIKHAQEKASNIMNIAQNAPYPLTKNLASCKKCDQSNKKFIIFCFYHKRKFHTLVGHLTYQCQNNISLKKTMQNV